MATNVFPPGNKDIPGFSFFLVLVYSQTSASVCFFAMTLDSSMFGLIIFPVPALRSAKSCADDGSSYREIAFPKFLMLKSSCTPAAT